MHHAGRSAHLQEAERLRHGVQASGKGEIKTYAQAVAEINGGESEEVATRRTLSRRRWESIPRRPHRLFKRNLATFHPRRIIPLRNHNVFMAPNLNRQSLGPEQKKELTC